MSRSMRKNPFCSITVNGFRKGEKRDKVLGHRKYRRMTKVINLEQDIITSFKKYIDSWTWNKDGKAMFKNVKLMRK